MQSSSRGKTEESLGTQQIWTRRKLYNRGRLWSPGSTPHSVQISGSPRNISHLTPSKYFLSYNLGNNLETSCEGWNCFKYECSVGCVRWSVMGKMIVWTLWTGLCQCGSNWISIWLEALNIEMNVEQHSVSRIWLRNWLFLITHVLAPHNLFVPNMAEGRRLYVRILGFKLHVEDFGGC